MSTLSSGSRRRDAHGQSLVEFALLLPLFMIVVLGLIEFGFAFNALLGINFASRNAALTAAEAGDAPGADCLILRGIDLDITSPAEDVRVSEVRIYWSDKNGRQIGSAANVYRRTGTTSCTYPGRAAFTVPYTRVSAGYPEATRCNVLAGCGGGHDGVDTIGVQIAYNYSWITPLRNVVPLPGGYTFTRANAMRMEPVL